jgi:hypothetical protein
LGWWGLRGQGFILAAILSLILVMMFAPMIVDVFTPQSPSMVKAPLDKSCLSALDSIASSKAIESLFNGDDSQVRLILSSTLPPHVYYNLTVCSSGFRATVYNHAGFTPEVTLNYIYTSVDLRRTSILTLSISYGGGS